MATELTIPPFLVQQAKALGVNIDPHIEYDPEVPLVKLSLQYQGQQPDFGAEDCDMGCDCIQPGFGGLFGKVFKASGLKKTAEKMMSKKAGKKITISNVKVNYKKTFVGLGKGLAIGAAAVSMAVPGVNVLTGSAVAGALAAGDKLLGSKNIKQAGRIISNTKAMASLGDPAAKRAAIVLGTVSQIRQAKGVQPGQRAIPYAGKVPTKPFVQYVPKTYATTLATKRVEQAKLSPKTKSFWIRLKELFMPPKSVTVTARA
jgi:hypothetical protein